MMANLSNLLGDVYGGGDDPSDEHHEAGDERAEADDERAQADDEATSPTDDAEATSPTGRVDAPAWASDDRLDAAFGDWTAGELPGTEPDEREQLDQLGETAEAHAPAESPDLAESAESAESAEDATSPQPEPGLWPATPQVRALAAGELERPPATEPKPAPSDVAMSDLTSVAQSPAPQPAEAQSAAPQPDDRAAGPTTLWQRDNDDILPGGGRRGLGRLLGR